MKCAKRVYNQINQLTSDLVGTAICDDQNFPIRRGDTWDTCSIEISKIDIASALKNKPYHELFYELEKARSYNLKLLDGALIQLQYRFDSNSLTAHRLAFYPNPDLSTFQNTPEEYLEDDIYLDIVDQRIVATPFRFDFDVRDEVAKNISHPRSHFTIGQYQNCRIPVERPLFPYQFIDFIIRNFYHNAHLQYSCDITKYEDLFDSTITDEELKLIHIGIT